LWQLFIFDVYFFTPHTTFWTASNRLVFGTDDTEAPEVQLFASPFLRGKPVPECFYRGWLACGDPEDVPKTPSSDVIPEFRRGGYRS
jgi:hypothetical protein